MAADTSHEAKGRRILIASFAAEEDVLDAAWVAGESGLRIVDVFTPYALHGLDRPMGLAPTRLPWACLGFGVCGVVFALWFQFWVMTVDWPMNVGGKPWNSLPAFVPVTFEVMVLLAGLGAFGAFLIRCRLFPGKQAGIWIPDATKDRFVMVIDASAETFDRDSARKLCRDFHAIYADEREG